MKVLLVEPYMTGSHAQWAEGYQRYSSHDVQILSLKGQYWKWRMHGGAVELASRYEQLKWKPDVIFVSDMLDLTIFLALTRQQTVNIPTAIYFHENQLCYPWSPEDRDVVLQRDHHYGFINYVSALSADRVFFNSGFHRDSFFEALSKFLNHFPDHRGTDQIRLISAKSEILHLGLDLRALDRYKSRTGKNRIPLILWNHRWEYDKNPEDFFNALHILVSEGFDFQVAVLGKNFQQIPEVFQEAKTRLKKRIVQFGYVDQFEKYARWLWKADILPVTSIHDFFGASVVEAVYCGCFPVLPDRLAYKELFEENGDSLRLYYNFNEYIKMLKQVLNKYPDLDCDKYKVNAGRYDWSEMAPIYDKTLYSLRKNRS